MVDKVTERMPSTTRNYQTIVTSPGRGTDTEAISVCDYRSPRGHYICRYFWLLPMQTWYLSITTSSPMQTWYLFMTTSPPMQTWYIDKLYSIIQNSAGNSVCISTSHGAAAWAVLMAGKVTIICEFYAFTNNALNFWFMTLYLWSFFYLDSWQEVILPEMDKDMYLLSCLSHIIIDIWPISRQYYVFFLPKDITQ